ncbi:MAG TPA: VOC family protein [Gaiellaceae bacterium]|jgi:hypothetical protein|nr:VOC family protein [Gaiellaceae bacterium]
MSTPVKTLIGKFVWHENYSGDVEAAKRFYSELFGWDFETWKPGEADYAMVKVDDRMHAGFMTVQQEGAPAHWLGIVEVENCDETARNAAAVGGTVHAGPFDIPDVGRFAVIADPQGAVLAAMASESDSHEQPAAEGVFVWDELHTSDIEDAKRFYGEVFGWGSEDMDMGEAGTYTLFKRAGGPDPGGGMQTADDPTLPHWLVYVYADDIDATASRAGELGGAVLFGPEEAPGVGRLAILQDPQSAVFGIFKPAPGQA